MDNNQILPSSVIVVGLGYVGLPLALSFSKKLPTIGFDVDNDRVKALQNGVDHNSEVDAREILSSDLMVTSDPACISDAEFIIVTVPTPITDDHKPDLRMLESASVLIGNQLRGRRANLPAPIIVFESTTYPGCTEEFCAPLIEAASGLRSGAGFTLGYSPERTNFGDSEHTLENVIKVVSGQTPKITDVIAYIYGLIASAGVYVAENIRTAEASKVIENIQRDLNIALFNELAMLFDRMNIRSSDVFDAAATKWNFHRYKPGIVGGHCIPVDPYYLTYKAESLGMESEIVLAGRSVNEKMTDFIAGKIIKLLGKNKVNHENLIILVLGQTFKSDVADIRNSKAILLVAAIEREGVEVSVYDPLVSDPSDKALRRTITNPFDSNELYDAVIVATPHQQFLDRQEDIPSLVKSGGFVVDVCGSLDKDNVMKKGRYYWAP